MPSRGARPNDERTRSSHSPKGRPAVTMVAANPQAALGDLPRFGPAGEEEGGVDRHLEAHQRDSVPQTPRAPAVPGETPEQSVAPQAVGPRGGHYHGRVEAARVGHGAMIMPLGGVSSARPKPLDSLIMGYGSCRCERRGGLEPPVAMRCGARRREGVSVADRRRPGHGPVLTLARQELGSQEHASHHR